MQRTRLPGRLLGAQGCRPAAALGGGERWSLPAAAAETTDHLVVAIDQLAHTPCPLTIQVDCSPARLHFRGSLLQLRGAAPACTPVCDAAGNVLLFNGQVFGGSLHVPPAANDAALLFQALAAPSADVPAILGGVHGPWAAVFWQAATRTLWFGRDAFGEPQGERLAGPAGAVVRLETGCCCRAERRAEDRAVFAPVVCITSSCPFPDAPAPRPRPLAWLCPQAGAACCCTCPAPPTAASCWPLLRRSTQRRPSSAGRSCRLGSTAWRCRLQCTRRQTAVVRQMR